MSSKQENFRRLALAMDAKRRTLEMHVMVVRRRIEALEQSERALFEAMNEPYSFRSAMVQLDLKRLQSIRQRKRALAAELEGLKLRSLESRRDVKRCETLAERERLAAVQGTAARQLDDAIQFTLLKRRAE
jgi:hypothetical protein